MAPTEDEEPRKPTRASSPASRATKEDGQKEVKQVRAPPAEPAGLLSGHRGLVVGILIGVLMMMLSSYVNGSPGSSFDHQFEAKKAKKAKKKSEMDDRFGGMAAMFGLSKEEMDEMSKDDEEEEDLPPVEVSPLNKVLNRVSAMSMQEICVAYAAVFVCFGVAGYAASGSGASKPVKQAAAKKDD